MGVKLNPPLLLTPELDLTEFFCGRAALDDWLKTHALQAGSSGTANTFVLLDENASLIGYYSLLMGSISQIEATERVRKGTGRYPIPVIVVARLAVDQRFQGQGLGRALLRDAVIRGVNISKEVAFRAIITHPIDEEAANFYTKYGFQQSPVSSGQLMILVKDVRKALGINSSVT